MRICVLSAGSSMGAAQVGVLKYLLGDLETKYDGFCGSSVGAINCSFLAQYKSGQEEEAIIALEKLWRGLKTSDIYQHWINLPKPLNYIGYIVGLFKPSIYNSAPLAELLKKHCNPEQIKNSGKKLRIGAVSLNSGNYHVFDENCPYLINAIAASSSIPGLFLPIHINNEYFIDGGVKNYTPIRSAVLMGATEIDVIVTNPIDNLFTEVLNISSISKLGTRIINIISNNIYENDLNKTLQINKQIENGEDVPGKRFIKIRIFRPSEKLTNSFLDFDQKNIGPMIDKGYEDAKRIAG